MLYGKTTLDGARAPPMKRLPLNSCQKWVEKRHFKNKFRCIEIVFTGFSLKFPVVTVLYNQQLGDTDTLMWYVEILNRLQKPIDLT